MTTRPRRSIHEEQLGPFGNGICPVCEKASERCGRRWLYCFDCLAAAARLRGRAHNAVMNAVRAGALPAQATVKCTDCGRTAHAYDHRDYAYPLDVEPVCRACNWLRGPAKQLQPGFRVAAGQGV